MHLGILPSSSTQIEWIFRIILAAVCGGIIGYERAVQRKSAGVRTHIVVAIAASLFMLVSKYGFMDVLYLHNISLDPSRIAAQVVTGISFIGAGAILVRNVQISGLTTAAGIWATAAISMAIGAGMYLFGILSTFFLFIVEILFHEDAFISKIIYHVRFNIQIEANNSPHILEKIKSELQDNNVENLFIKILDISDEKIVFTVEGIISHKINENDIILALKNYDDIIRIIYIPGGK